MFKAGETLILEYGAYSDYDFAGPFRVLSDFSPTTALEEFRAESPDDKDRESAFIAWLARKGLIEDLPTSRWYLGEYGIDATTHITKPGEDYVNVAPKSLIEEESAANAKEEEERAGRYSKWLEENPGCVGTTSMSVTIKA